MEDLGYLDTTYLTATLMLLGFVLLWWWRVLSGVTWATLTPPSSLPHYCYRVRFPLWGCMGVTRGDSGFLDTTKLTASLLLSGPHSFVVVEGSDPR